MADRRGSRLATVPLSRVICDGVKYVIWLLSLPLRLFDAIASRFVSPPVDRNASREELRAQRDFVLEEMKKPPPPMV